MKIAIYNRQEFNPMIGGVERVSVSLCKELQKRGTDVIFIAVERSSFSKEYTLPAPQYMLPDIEEITEANVSEFQRILAEENVDIVVNQCFYFQTSIDLCARVRERTGLPLVTVMHFDPEECLTVNRNRYDRDFFSFSENLHNIAAGIRFRWPFVKYRTRHIRTLYASAYNTSDHVVLLSQNFVEPFKKISCVNDDSKFVVIPNMLSFSYKDGVDLSYKTKQILFVGRLEVTKAPYKLLRVWRIIQDRLPGWKLVLVGDGPWRNKLEKLAERYKLHDVEFKGFAPSEDYFRQSQILCLTSLSEGFGLVLTEAMQYGCVPLAFNSFGSASDIINNGRNGVLVKPFDIERYAAEVEKLVHSPLLPSYAVEGNISIQKFLPERVMEKWMHLFNQILDS